MALARRSLLDPPTTDELARRPRRAGPTGDGPGRPRPRRRRIGDRGRRRVHPLPGGGPGLAGPGHRAGPRGRGRGRPAGGRRPSRDRRGGRAALPLGRRRHPRARRGLPARAAEVPAGRRQLQHGRRPRRSAARSRRLAGGRRRPTEPRSTSGPAATGTSGGPSCCARWTRADSSSPTTTHGIAAVCAHDVTRAGFVGPVAVRPDLMGRGAGVAPLLGALHEMRRRRSDPRRGVVGRAGRAVRARRRDDRPGLPRLPQGADVSEVRDVTLLPVPREVDLGGRDRRRSRAAGHASAPPVSRPRATRSRSPPTAIALEAADAAGERSTGGRRSPSSPGCTTAGSPSAPSATGPTSPSAG